MAIGCIKCKERKNCIYAVNVETQEGIDICYNCLFKEQASFSNSWFILRVDDSNSHSSITTFPIKIKLKHVKIQRMKRKYNLATKQSELQIVEESVALLELCNSKDLDDLENKTTKMNCKIVLTLEPCLFGYGQGPTIIRNLHPIFEDGTIGIIQDNQIRSYGEFMYMPRIVK